MLGSLRGTSTIVDSIDLLIHPKMKVNASAVGMAKPHGTLRIQEVKEVSAEPCVLHWDAGVQKTMIYFKILR